MGKGRKRKKRRRTLLIIAGLIAAVFLGLLGRYYAIRSKFTRVSFENLSPDERYRLTVKLMEQDVKDFRNDLRRDAYCSDLSHTKFLGKKTWDVMFPITYAGEKLFSQGRLALPSLLRIAKEEGSWLLVGSFDEPTILPAVISAYRNGEINHVELEHFLQWHLPRLENPLPPPGYKENKEINAFIETHLSGKGYEEICLGFLDEVMKTKGDYDPLRLWGKDDTIRWFNKAYDYDLDEWLAEKAPDALAFRNRELMKGYDPAIGLDVFAGSLYFGMIDEGIKAVFPDRKDRKACRRLIEVVDGNFYESPHLRPERWIDEGGWEDRLRKWYWKNRDKLVYDFEKHRFMVKKESDEAP